ncbi:MAG: MarR family transcriptional regulator [Acetobacteraceae bacterium]
MRYICHKCGSRPIIQASSEHRERLGPAEYRQLSEFRYLLGRFLEFSERAARRAGLTPRQHQALLAIKGFPGGEPLSIHDLADRLRIRHHSAVELVDRLTRAGLAERRHDPRDRRRVLIRLMPAAERDLRDLSAIHLEELHRLGPALTEIVRALAATGQREEPASGTREESRTAGDVRHHR